MKLIDIILIAAIAVVCGIVVWKLIVKARNRKSGCGGDCSNCGGCSFGSFKKK